MLRIGSWNVDENIQQPEYAQKPIDWFQNKLNSEIENINDLYDKFRLSEALMAVYKLFWDEFSSWYVELIKPAYQHSEKAVASTIRAEGLNPQAPKHFSLSRHFPRTDNPSGVLPEVLVWKVLCVHRASRDFS